MQLSGEKSDPGNHGKIPEVGAMLVRLRKSKEDFADGTK